MKKPVKKAISLRLQKKLLRDLKRIAKSRGVKYQTLINQVLEEGLREYT